MPRPLKVIAVHHLVVDGKPVTLTEVEPPRLVSVEVHDTTTKAKLRPVAKKLTAQWCECDSPEFMCYPGDNECPCGVAKHHVHCFCGGVMQVG